MVSVYKGMKFSVSDEVYKPAEDTFLLADNIEFREGERVLEIGTGSGLISVLAALEGAKVVATDINNIALDCARRNAERHGVEADIDFREGDLFGPIGETEKFDLVIFNPPYLPVSEDEHSEEILERAWDGGTDGRKIIDRFLDQVFDYLNSKGCVYFVQSSLTGVSETMRKLEGRNVEIDREEENYSFEKLYLFKASLKS